MNRIVIDLPIPPKAAHPNKSARNWRAKAGAKQTQRHTSKLIAMCYMRTSKLQFPWKRAKCQAHFVVATKHDEDNLVHWLKATFDGLQDAGLIVNDSGLTHERPTQVSKRDKTKHGVTLTIEEVNE